MATSNGTTTITISRETARALEAQAKAQGVSLDVYLQQLAGTNGDRPGTKKEFSGIEFDRELDEFFANNPEKLPALPADFSRADIYLDHD